MFPKEILNIIYEYGGESIDFYRHVYNHSMKRIKFLPKPNFVYSYFNGIVCSFDPNFYYFTTRFVKYKTEEHIGTSKYDKYAVCNKCHYYKPYYNFTNAIIKPVKLKNICIECRNDIRDKIKKTRDEMLRLSYIVDTYKDIYHIKVRINDLDNLLQDLRFKT